MHRTQWYTLLFAAAAAGVDPHADAFFVMEIRMFAALTAANRGRVAEALAALRATHDLARRSESGAMMARVGQASRQAVQLPQRSSVGSSIGRGSEMNNSPRKNQLPPSRASRFVCLPIQPSPALRARGFSITGPESTNTR